MKFALTILCLFSVCQYLAPEAKAQAERESYEHEFDQTYPIEAKAEMDVVHSYGKATVQTWEKNEVRVWARIEAEGENAREFGEQVRIKVDPKGGEFEVETDYPGGDWSKGEDFYYGVELKIWMPPGHDLEIENSYGHVELIGIKGDVEAEVSYGQLAATGINGKTDLTCAFGNLSLEESEGDTRVTVNNGSLRVSEVKAKELHLENDGGHVLVAHVQGNTKISNSNGKVEARDLIGGIDADCGYGNQVYENIQGPLRAKGKNGNIDVMIVAGDVRVENAYGSIVVREVTGDVRLETKNGSVTAVQIEGSAHIENAYGDVGAVDIKGDLKATNNNGQVHVNRVGGNTDIENAYGHIRADDLNGDVKIENKNGKISAKILSYWNKGKKKGNDIHLENAMGLIQIDLPDPPSFELDAKTTYGRLRSDFNLPAVEGDSTTHKSRCTVGEGTAKIKLRTSHGDISIVKIGKEPHKF